MQLQYILYKKYINIYIYISRSNLVGRPLVPDCTDLLIYLSLHVCEIPTKFSLSIQSIRTLTGTRATDMSVRGVITKRKELPKYS